MPTFKNFTTFIILLASLILAGLLSSQSTFAQSLVDSFGERSLLKSSRPSGSISPGRPSRPVRSVVEVSQTPISSFYEQDFRGVDSESRVGGGFLAFGHQGIHWILNADENPNLGIYEVEGRTGQNVEGKPSPGIEATADFSLPSSGESPLGTAGLSSLPSTNSVYGIVRNIENPDALVQWDFDLWTSQASPVDIRTTIEPPSRGSSAWEGYSGNVTNDSPNTWQTHSIVFSAFGMDPEDQRRRALLYEGIAVDTMHWRISTDDWGHEDENILRLDNIRMSIIPEPSTYAFAVALLLIAFITFRRRFSKGKMPMRSASQTHALHYINSIGSPGFIVGMRFKPVRKFR